MFVCICMRPTSLTADQLDGRLEPHNATHGTRARNASVGFSTESSRCEAYSGCDG